MYGLWTLKSSGNSGFFFFAASHTSVPLTPGLASSSS